MSVDDRVAEVEVLLAELREQDEAIERDVAELRALQSRVRALIHAFGSDGRQPRKISKGRNRGPSEEHVARLGDWLRERAGSLNVMNDGEGFYAFGLAKEMKTVLPKGVKAASEIGSVLAVLHERGIIERSSMANGPGGRKMFKVVSSSSN
jgi:hypothetical protein